MYIHTIPHYIFINIFPLFLSLCIVSIVVTVKRKLPNAANIT